MSILAGLSRSNDAVQTLDGPVNGEKARPGGPSAHLAEITDLARQALPLWH